MEPKEAERAAKILRLIFEDQSYEQVIEQMPGVTYGAIRSRMRTLRLDVD